MNTIFKNWLIIMLMGTTFLACNDHRLSPLASQRMRLKATNNLNFGGFPFSTSYSYDINNRVSSFTTSVGSTGQYQYDAQNRYLQFDYFPKAGDLASERTVFAYSLTNDDFTAKTDIMIGSVYFTGLKSTEYKFDGNKRLVGAYTTNLSGFPMVFTPHYTDDNITSADYTTGHNTNKIKYEYDNYPNPYYGLIAPDISEVRRFSRNNITKIIDGASISEYIYEYNAQGLPIKMTVKNGYGQIEYGYEPY